MAFLEFDKVGIRALAAAVPRTVVRNEDYSEFFPAEDVAKIIQKTGVVERRFADESTTASDLCYAAAEKLISDNNIDCSEIDLLIFISQTPDYRMPATSVILQNRLGLGTGTIAFDINLGCSAFIYGLTVAYSMLQNRGLRKALVLDGETRSKVYSRKDRRTAFLFGDGGVAALIERDESIGRSYFSINSDGSLEELIKIDAGGYRQMSSGETVKERVVDEYGNIRSLEQGHMDGADVFNFVLKTVPRDIKSLLERAGHSIEDFDYTLFHQANDFINSYLIKKLKIDPAKVPSTISKFGNTSSVSIPLTIVSELQGKLDGAPTTMLMSAFGVGMTWATAIVPFAGCHISAVVEV